MNRRRDCPGCRGPNRKLVCPQHGEVVHLLIDGCPPGYGKANTRYKARSTKKLSDEYKTFRDHVALNWMKARRPMYDPMELGVEIFVAVDRKFTVKSPLAAAPRGGTLPEPVVVGYIDVDALVKSILDALQHCGMLINDMVVTDERATKGYDKEHPRVEVWVWPLEEGARG